MEVFNELYNEKSQKLGKSEKSTYYKIGWSYLLYLIISLSTTLPILLILMFHQISVSEQECWADKIDVIFKLPTSPSYMSLFPLS